MAIYVEVQGGQSAFELAEGSAVSGVVAQIASGSPAVLQLAGGGFLVIDLASSWVKVYERSKRSTAIRRY